MPAFLCRRLTQMIPVLFVASVVMFALTMVLPGDPTFTILGETASAQQRHELREKMGLNDPLPVQYGRWAISALTGNLGTSLRTGEPVSDMLASRLPVTLELSFLAMLLGTLIGVPAGIISARWRNQWPDVTASVVALSALAIPFFWQAMLLIMLFSVSLALLPPSGYAPFLADPLGNLRSMILPVTTVGTHMAAVVTRQTRTAMLHTLSQDFIRTARAKGAPDYVVVGRHALRNALLPVITVVGLQTGALLGGTIITETIFSLPGLGQMIVEGIFRRDFAVVQGALMVIVLAVLAINLLTDIAYAFIDPRITFGARNRS